MKTKIVLLSFSVLMYLYGCKSNSDKAKPIENIGLENVTVNSEGFYNGADGAGKFTSGSATFLNAFDLTFGSWSGWAASQKTDTADLGSLNYTNQYSVYASSGGDDSRVFAVANAFDSSTIVFAKPSKVISCQIANSTYSYHSLKNGSLFSKKFGEGDFFLLLVEGFGADDKKTGEIEYYLADFRASASPKGIKLGWKTLDLAKLGTVKRLRFSLSSSDTSPQFGMNNPSYFCLDNLKIN